MRLYGQSVAIWDGVLRSPVERDYRVSLCTTCMGRLLDLQVTLPKNIDDNHGYPNVEFVVLDYNSEDGLESWMRTHMMRHIESGLVAYYRTTEPFYYSMSHSRNLAFALASGDIVNNVDADNWTGAGFAAYINQLANQCSSRAIFAKGRQLIHGRLGFYKQDWESLGGYDESLDSYGFDDKDLMYRAWMLGFKLMWFGGAYCSRIKTPRFMKTVSMSNKNWKASERANQAQSEENIRRGLYVANLGRKWAAAHVVKNFGEEIIVGKGSEPDEEPHGGELSA